MSRRPQRRQWTLGEHFFWTTVWLQAAFLVAWTCYFVAVTP